MKNIFLNIVFFLAFNSFSQDCDFRHDTLFINDTPLYLGSDSNSFKCLFSDIAVPYGANYKRLKHQNKYCAFSFDKKGLIITTYECQKRLKIGDSPVSSMIFVFNDFNLGDVNLGSKNRTLKNTFKNRLTIEGTSINSNTKILEILDLPLSGINLDSAIFSIENPRRQFIGAWDNSFYYLFTFRNAKLIYVNVGLFVQKTDSYLLEEND